MKRNNGATKDKWLHLRITPDERRLIYAISSLQGDTASEWARKIINDKIKEFFKRRLLRGK